MIAFSQKRSLELKDFSFLGSILRKYKGFHKMADLENT